MKFKGKLIVYGTSPTISLIRHEKSAGLQLTWKITFSCTHIIIVLTIFTLCSCSARVACTFCKFYTMKKEPHAVMYFVYVAMVCKPSCVV